MEEVPGIDEESGIVKVDEKDQDDFLEFAKRFYVLEGFELSEGLLFLHKVRKYFLRMAYFFVILLLLPTQTDHLGQKFIIIVFPVVSLLLGEAYSGKEQMRTVFLRRIVLCGESLLVSLYRFFYTDYIILPPF